MVFMIYFMLGEFGIFAIVGKWALRFQGVLKDFKDLLVEYSEMVHGWIELVGAIYSFVEDHGGFGRLGGFFIGLGCLAYCFFTEEEDLSSGRSSPSPSGASTPSMSPPPGSLNFASMVHLTQAQNQMNKQAFETKLTAALARLEAKNVQGVDVGSSSEEIKRMMMRLDDFEKLVREDVGMRRKEEPVTSAPAPPPPSRVAGGHAWGANAGMVPVLTSLPLLSGGGEMDLLQDAMMQEATPPKARKEVETMQGPVQDVRRRPRTRTRWR